MGTSGYLIEFGCMVPVNLNFLVFGRRGKNFTKHWENSYQVSVVVFVVKARTNDIVVARVEQPRAPKSHAPPKLASRHLTPPGPVQFWGRRTDPGGASAKAGKVNSSPHDRRQCPPRRPPKASSDARDLARPFPDPFL